MTEPIYFQWQNEVLLKTIYPLRALKLIDFLVYFREVELWAEYEARSDESLLGEKNDYIKAQAQLVQDMKTSFACLKEHVIDDVLKDQPVITLVPLAAAQVDQIRKMHKICKDNLPLLKGDLRKEKIFMSQRLTDWEEYHKELSRKLGRKPGMKKGPPDDPVEIVSAELLSLRELVSIYNRIDKRRVELIPIRKKNLERKAQLEQELSPLDLTVRNKQAELDGLEDTIRRIQVLRADSNPDAIGRAKERYKPGNLLSKLTQTFKGGDLGWLDKFSRIWTLLSVMVTAQGFDVMQKLARNEIDDLKRLKSDLERRIAGGEADLARLAVTNPNQAKEIEATLTQLRNFDLNTVMAELDQLANLAVALEFIIDKNDRSGTKQRSAQDIEKDLGTKQGMVRDLRGQLEGPDGYATKAKVRQVELDSINEYLNKSSDANLLNFISDNPMEPDKVERKDLARYRSENYRNELSALELPELLETVVSKFLAAPAEYPLWLQYMVIHFSGMRYASAHGSWADPRDLLTNLSSSYIAESFRMEDNDSIQARCEEKLECYTDWQTALAEPGRLLPKMIRVMDPQANVIEPRIRWKEKVDDHIVALQKALQSQTPESRRKALLDLLIEEATYEIESKTGDEILELLKGVKDFLSLPDWMWNEIVKLTELRVTEVKKDNDDDETNDDAWEKPLVLTPEIAKSEEFRKYGEMMSQWKKNNLTSWREAHEESDRLIVSRAVCNEVAEHIQHLRGYRGAAGLTEKPNWYRREDNRFGKLVEEQQDDDHPYFIKPKSSENFQNDFQVGASILWLRFVNGEPSEWQIAEPLTTRAGDSLIPAVYRIRNDDDTKWKYTIGPKNIQRNRKEPGGHQWLRWMHEATVAKVAPTADGNTVLTFETALPNEDRRLSTIGIIKRDADDLVNDMGEDGYNPAFVGFVPEGQTSVEDLDQYAEDPVKYMEKQGQFVENLEEMLDWNKILQRTVMSPEELDAYQEKYIRNRIPTAPPKLPPEEDVTAPRTATSLQISNVANQPPPLRAWRVKWDWQGLAEYKGFVREIAPNPCVFRCGELNDNLNGHYVPLDEAWQNFWFDLCCYCYFGRSQKNLSDRQRNWLANRWESLGSNGRAFNNQHGLDKFHNYITNERTKLEDPKIYTLVCGGATLTGTVVRNAKGVDMLQVDHFDGNQPPPKVDTIDPYTDPRIFFANIITKKQVRDENNKEGYKVVRFPQLRGRDAPVPLIARTDIYYPLGDLEEIFTGVKPSPYFP